MKTINDSILEREEREYNSFGSQVRRMSTALNCFAEPYIKDVYKELNIKEPRKGEENDDYYYFLDFMFFAGAMSRGNLIEVAILDKATYEADSPEKTFFDALAECSNISKIRNVDFDKKIEIGKAFFNRGVDFMDDRLHDALMRLTNGSRGGKIL